jgi:phosphosulfolactate synthase (CoM biosynthesis protein A)
MAAPTKPIDDFQGSRRVRYLLILRLLFEAYQTSSGESIIQSVGKVVNIMNSPELENSP